LEFERINKAAVADEVIRQLLDQMIAGALKAGDKLPSESEMADMFGVGRNSVREAIKVLQTLGIVERWQGDGSYVAESYKMPFDWLLFPLLSRVRTSSDLVELRRVLEIGVTELVIEKASPEDFDELEKKIEAMEQVGQQDPLDGDAAVETDVEFHIALARVTRNPALEQLSELVMRLFAPSMKKHLTSPEGIIHAREDHRIFFGALKMRDRDQARRSVFEAFEHWKRFIDLSS
jgi:DNA-binding FadR family transcriptional regulator